MEPNLYHLKYFIDAANMGGIAPAAKKNLVSSSAISQAIKKLEESFNCQLLEHNKNQFQLTPEGRIAAESIDNIIHSIADLKTKIANSKSDFCGTLPVATLRSLAMVLFPSAISSINKKYPNLKATLMIGHTKNILDQVLNDEIEVGIVVDNNAIHGVKKYILHEGYFKFVVGYNHKENVKNLGVLATDEKPGINEVKKNYKSHFGKPAPIAMIVESWEVIARFASAGLGIGFIPDFVARSVPHLELVEIFPELSNKIRYKIVVISKGALSSHSQVLFNELERSTVQILK
jgi:DNA-binding transcriptional LysR family regulator